MLYTYLPVLYYHGNLHVTEGAYMQAGGVSALPAVFLVCFTFTVRWKTPRCGCGACMACGMAIPGAPQSPTSQMKPGVILTGDGRWCTWSQLVVHTACTGGWMSRHKGKDMWDGDLE